MSQVVFDEAQDPRLLDRIVREIDTKGDLPAGADVIQQLQTAIRKENCNSAEIVRIILKDTALASKVLRVVNSSFYRRGSTTVSTVTGAIVLLGFQTIRDLSAGLLLIDHFARVRGPSRKILDELGRSLYCGLLSQTLSGRVSYPSPEEAYLLGLVANFAHLWLAAYYPSLFDRAADIRDRRHVSMDRALAQVLGGGPEPIAATALEHWNFPSHYVDHFRGRPPSDRSALVTRTGKLSAIVDVSSCYVAGALEDGVEASSAAVRRFAGLFALKPEVFLDAARAADREFCEQAPLNGLPGKPLVDTTLVASVFEAAAEKSSPRAVRTAESPVGTMSGGADAGSEEAKGPDRGDAVAPPPAVSEGDLTDSDGTERVLSAIKESLIDGASINDTLLLIVDGLARLGRFDAAFLALLNPAADRIIGRIGHGPGVDEAIARLDVPVKGSGGLLAKAIRQGAVQVAGHASASVLMPRGTDSPHIPGRSFIVHPVIARGRAVGALVAGRALAARPTLDDHALLRTFCDQVSLTLEKFAEKTAARPSIA